MTLHVKPEGVPAQPYDPAYDPLVDKTPGCNRDYAPTYWIATAGPPPADDGPITSDVDADVVVIGSGFTGLSCALSLAREHGIKATVLEANRVAWGCSTRNGGQGQTASGRLSRSQWIARYGRETALKLHAEIMEGFEYFSDLVREFDPDPSPAGTYTWRIVAEPSTGSWRNPAVANDVFGYRTRMLGSEELKRDWLDEAGAVGALYEPLGTGIHPGKFAFGYLKAARAAGAKVHPSSAVLGIEHDGAGFRVRTSGGTVRARAVAIATGGYTSQQLHPRLRSRIMPILSNSLVTRPLTPDEMAASIRTTTFVTDTRTLRFYYRRLPDNRVQIGSRSAITGADATNPRHLRSLVDGLHRKFPVLEGIQVDYSWWGWVDVSHDMMPRIVQPSSSQRLFYAVGYGGNGVSYSSQAGRRMAALIAGRPSPGLPIFQSELRGHLFAPFRRLGQRMLYQLYERRDEAPDRA